MKIISVALFFVFTFVQNVCAELPEQSRELQLIWVKEGFQVGLDNDPAWDWLYEDSNRTFTVMSPENYYPPTVGTVKRLPITMAHKDDYYVKLVVLKALNTIMYRTGVDKHFTRNDLHSATYGSLTGYEVNYRWENEGEIQDTSLFIGRTSGNAVVSLSLTTLPDKLPHIAHFKQRLWGNIKFLRQ